MRKTTSLAVALILLTGAAAARAESRSVLLLVKHNKDKAVEVAIRSDEKQERRDRASVDAACGLVKEMKGWGSVVNVFVVCEQRIPRQDLKKLLNAIDGNPWLELAYLRQGLPKGLAEHYLKTQGVDDGATGSKAGDSEEAGAEPGRPAAVSLIQLIATPAAYHGKYVRIQGFVRIEHEGTAVYLHKEDWQRSLTKNGVWLAANDATPEGSKEAQVNNHYALIEGRFNAHSRGHLGLWSGSIENITRMEPWAVRKDAP